MEAVRDREIGDVGRDREGRDGGEREAGSGRLRYCAEIRAVAEACPERGHVVLPEDTSQVKLPGRQR